MRPGLTHQAHFNALINLAQIQQVLRDDLIDAIPQNAVEATPQKRRSYIRNGIAMVEGTSAGMISIALADAEAGVTEFDAGEIVILRGQKYDLNDEGGARGHPDKQKLTRTVRFSFAVMSRTYGVPFTLEVANNGWRCFKATVLVRNRLVHPRTRVDLTVTDHELGEAAIAFEWFRSENLRFGNMVRESIPEFDDEAPNPES
jgi:hypothetical protein